MPITVDATLKRIGQAEFGEIAYDVMRHIFDVHSEFGRLFNEQIYQHEIASRCGGRVEVPIKIAYNGFKKDYFIDLLVQGGALFELKVAASITARHRAQAIHYLLLTGLAHAK